MDVRKTVGDFGEQLAVTFLERQGYRIIGRQVRTRFGEIDIVAETPDLLLFVEVKTRRTNAYGSPEESITKAKRLHIKRSVESYRATQHLLAKACRVDALVISLDISTHQAHVRQIQNILEE